MGFTRFEEDIKVHQSLSDYPNSDDGMSANDLKRLFDGPAESLQDALNGLMTELEATTAGGNIGVEAINENDESGNTLIAKLRYIFASLSNITMGQVPDNSITKSKINSTYEATLVKKTIYDLISKYTIPTYTELDNDHNHLALDNEINDYEKGMRVLINTETQYMNFDSSIIPELAANNVKVAGYSADYYQIADKDDDTYVLRNVSTNEATLTLPILIKPTKIKLVYDKQYYSSSSQVSNKVTLYGMRQGSTSWEELYVDNDSVESETKVSQTITLSTNYYYTKFKLSSYHPNRGNQRLYTLDIVEGSAATLNPEITSYININSLGNKLISNKMEQNKYYELIYNGTYFEAKER